MPVIDTGAAVGKFDAALYTQAEASRYLGLPKTTFRNWARGYHLRRAGRDIVGNPVITALAKSAPLGAVVPFVGLAEGYALAAIRAAGVPLQRIRPALEQLSDEMGTAHALASQRLYTDGAEVLFDYARTISDHDAAPIRDLVVVRDGQRVLTEVVADYLKRVEFGTDGYASVVPLPGFQRAKLVADVKRSFGQPIFARGGVRLEDAISLFAAERDVDLVAEEYGIPRRELEDVLGVLVKGA